MSRLCAGCVLDEGKCWSWREFRGADQDAGLYKQNRRVVQEPLLEGGDGVDARGPPELGQDHVRQRHSCESLF